jgi:hypothetical protein
VNASNAINFHRKGHVNYLLRLYYGGDNTFSSLIGAYSHLDDLNFPVSVQQIEKNNFATLIYPVPATNTDVHLNVIGADVNEYKTCTIISSTGNIVYQGEPLIMGAEIILPTSKLASGTYFVKIANAKAEEISEQIIIN